MLSLYINNTATTVIRKLGLSRIESAEPIFPPLQKTIKLNFSLETETGLEGVCEIKKVEGVKIEKILKN